MRLNLNNLHKCYINEPRTTRALLTLSFISIRQVNKSLKMNLGLYPPKKKQKQKQKNKKKQEKTRKNKKKQEKNYKAFYYLLETFVFQLRI